ncbi:hypothetical protein [Dyadobacter bucti]|uniref:hypothetical protein n=1 Tax=Dyadobacter bucti TaxID=2572203 RepID=UPI003F7060A5
MTGQIKTLQSRPILNPKIVAEEAAWEFIRNQGEGMELVVISPVGIFGPIIGGICPNSFEEVTQAILEGNIKEIPAFTFGVVDVRDVADIHIKATYGEDYYAMGFVYDQVTRGKNRTV